MEQRNNLRVLDEDFPVEVAFWEANRAELTRQYPGQYLIIRGSAVCGTLNTLQELFIAEEKDFPDNPCLVRLTDGPEGPRVATVPFVWVTDDASA